jgi:hypothetical protein
MNTARAKYVEDLYLKLIASRFAPDLGKFYAGVEEAIELTRQLHISLITEENDKAKMPNMKLDGDDSTPVARDHQNDQLRDISIEEFNGFCASAGISVFPCTLLRDALNKFIESRRHG